MSELTCPLLEAGRQSSLDQDQARTAAAAVPPCFWSKLDCPAGQQLVTGSVLVVVAVLVVVYVS